MKIESKQELRIITKNHTQITMTQTVDGVEMTIREPDTGYGMQEKIGRTVEITIAAGEIGAFAQAVHQVAAWFGVAGGSTSEVVIGGPQVIRDVHFDPTETAKLKLAEQHRNTSIGFVDDDMYWNAIKASYAALTPEDRAALRREMEEWDNADLTDAID